MSFLPAYCTVTAEGSSPTRSVFILHGILGSKRNWRSFAALLADAFPAWQVVLVDLRNHGDSKAAPPPHDLASTAADVARLAGEIGPPTTIVGHSFGGKIAALLGRDHGHGRLRRVVILDCPLGAVDSATVEGSEVTRMIDLLRSLPPIDRRAGVTEYLLQGGMSAPVARWMATNLERHPHGRLVWRFELPGVEEMIADYWRTDLDAVLGAPPPGLEIQVIRGGRSDRYSAAEIATLERLALHGRVVVDVLASAGHWLHVDDPIGLVGLLGRSLR